MYSGGAPLSEQIRMFCVAVFSCDIIECYGQTEVAGCLTSTASWDPIGGHVGGVLPCLRMHLKDLPDSNSTQDSKSPKGEICVKGNSVMLGYYKEP